MPTEPAPPPQPLPRHAWILPGRLAVSRRPGGACRGHRRDRRVAELAWWRDQGVAAIVSALPTRHCLVDYADAGFAVRWHPLRDPEGAGVELAALADEVHALLDELPDGEAVLVHCDMANEWLAAIDAALRLRLGLARSRRAALAAAAADGLPVGSLATSLVASARAAP